MTPRQAQVLGYIRDYRALRGISPTYREIADALELSGKAITHQEQPVLEAILKEQEVLHERAQPYLDDPSLLRSIIADGCERARRLAQETMRDVREAMGLDYG